MSTAWVIGASSGIGAAIACQLAHSGFQVGLTGRNLERLAAEVEKINAGGGNATAFRADVTERRELEGAFHELQATYGEPHLLVHCAGTNVTRRWWDDLDVEGVESVVATNLSSVIGSVDLVLPGMRKAQSGQIVVVSSWAGWRYMSGAGVGYGASKAALSPLVESINDQEGLNGIRATHLCPGEVRTPILYTKEVPPTEEEIAQMLPPERVAEAVDFITGMPADTCINELVISGTANGIYSRVGYHQGRSQ